MSAATWLFDLALWGTVLAVGFVTVRDWLNGR